MFEVKVYGIKVYECSRHAQAIAWMEARGIEAWINGVELHWED